MLFHTPEFFVLLTVILILYYAMPKSRIVIMALANAVFYAATGAAYFVLFFGIVSLVYALSRQLHSKYGKLVYGLSLVIVIGNLAFFKYSLFALHNVERALGIQWLAMDSFLAKVALPIGISFYTFQLIAYLVDVRKGKLQPSRSWIEFWVFISYFAHSLAGPILRGSDFLPQLERVAEIRFSPSRFKLGLAYLCMGLVKKVVLADWITPYADSFFAKGAAMSGGEAWVAAYLFAFQIYFDFSAYSEMAVGIGYMMGVRLDLNFKTPYLSGSATEFWRRWHITLSSWIRDYIYIPLGGSRKGEIRQYANLVAAMAISGLWHGAAWTFVVWGLFHGGLQVAHKMYTGLLGKLGLGKLPEFRLYRWLTIAVFFHLVCISWVLFRVEGIRTALHLIKKMLLLPQLSFAGLAPYLAVAAGLFLLHIAEYNVRKRAGTISIYWHRYVPAFLRGAVYTAFIVAVILMMKSGQNNFIYFKF
ncbi:MBOAT family protein [Paenibacillus athensensis]|uniref:MBOAT family protein n=1 Tax=Paenibacillus athensensis TaxID=1967502 RepID=A0A4Y8PU83_9BACL|nr:MBOAT family O-acyltransferase [Paenibacillus athensensis]MCD1260479.1 MBOAT family protein [Paenibacillus athensensis]